MRKTKEVLVRTSTHAPHVAIEKDCYINHNELLQYIKDSIKHYEKEIDRELDILIEYATEGNTESVETTKRFIVKYCDMISQELNGQLSMLDRLNCIKDTQYKWYKNYIGNHIRWRYDATFWALGL